MKRSLKTGPVLAFVSALLLALSAPAMASCGSFVVKNDIPYGPVSPLQKLDVYGFKDAENCPPRPVVVFVHGGAWRSGDKSEIDQKPELFRKRNNAVFVSVNYRLTPEIRYPSHTEDVADAIRWVVDHVAQYGGDPRKITLMGHSAGGQIATLIAMHPRFLPERKIDPKSIRCLIINDTPVFNIERFMAADTQNDKEMYRTAFGPSPETWRDASPVTHVPQAAHIPATLVLTRGIPRRMSVAARFAGFLVKHGHFAQAYAATSHSHLTIDTELGLENPLTENVIRFWKAKCG